MKVVPLTIRAANDFVEQWHRHSSRTNNYGGKYAIGLEAEGQLVGVAIVGRPTARLLQVPGAGRTREAVHIACGAERRGIEAARPRAAHLAAYGRDDAAYLYAEKGKRCDDARRRHLRASRRCGDPAVDAAEPREN